MRFASEECTREDLCADGIWRLSASARSVLDRQIASLPQTAVSDDETRYPIDPKSMRAFLQVFFTRHLLQIHNSIIGYLGSVDLQEAVRSHPLRVLDIGSGPAVASLAIMDLLRHTLCAAESPGIPLCPPVFRMVHVLNDTSPICLTTGTRMLADYFQYGRERGSLVSDSRVFTLRTGFPGNVSEIHRLAFALGGYDLILLSYAMNPLVEGCGLRSLVTGVRALERLCTPNGRVLIIQDKFQEPLVRAVARALGVQHRKQILTQEIYPSRGSHDIYTYTYYESLYVPRRKGLAPQPSAA